MENKEKIMALILVSIILLINICIYWVYKLNLFDNAYIIFNIICQIVLILSLIIKKLNFLKDPIHYYIPFAALLTYFVKNKALLILNIFALGIIIILWYTHGKCMLNDIDENGEETQMGWVINDFINKYIFDYSELPVKPFSIISITFLFILIFKLLGKL